MFTTTRKKIFGWAMFLMFLCAIMLIVYFIHGIIKSSDAISQLNALQNSTTADYLETAELISQCKWALFGYCAMLISTFVVAMVLEVMLYNQIDPFVTKTLPVCKKCGMTLEDDTPFCPYCGNDMFEKEIPDSQKQTRTSTGQRKTKTATNKKED